MEAGYRVHLANTAAIVQYSGLKYSDDDSDAAWLAKLLRLGLLPEGYIYPKAERAVRDLLRRRSRLVQQHTANLLAIQNLFARNRGRSLSGNEVKRLTPETVSRLLPDPNQALAVQGTLLVMRAQEGAIDLLERQTLNQVRLRPAFRHLLSASGIGQVLGLTIVLETGDIGRFAQVGHYASYCRCVSSERLSNGKAQGPRQHQERQQIPRLGVS
jgi:transposase